MISENYLREIINYYRVAKTHRMPYLIDHFLHISKRATNYRALRRKMTYKDKASYDSTPPCRR